MQLESYRPQSLMKYGLNHLPPSVEMLWPYYNAFIQFTFSQKETPIIQYNTLR